MLNWVPKMTPKCFDRFVDPEDGSPLSLRNELIFDGNVRFGDLENKKTGRIVYKVRDFIPVFSEEDNYTCNFGLQWQRHSRTQLDSENGSQISEHRLFNTCNWPKDMTGETILEAGSGAGRFTEVLARTGASVYSFDYSAAVYANYTNNGSKPNIYIFRGDIYRIPFSDEMFDRVICLGVLQHTPDVKKAFEALALKVKKGGCMAVDVYRKNIWHMAHWKYIMRPITTRMPHKRLYDIVRWYSTSLIPLAKVMRCIGGRAGHRLVPILDQSDKPISQEYQIDWTILDTYDALSATYDQPQTDATMIRWFSNCGFDDVHFKNGCGYGTKRL